MLEPQDLPGRYGRAVKALDQILHATGIEAAVAGGWAVWHHGYIGRVTQDIDIVLPADRMVEFLHVASFSGFEILPQPQGRWPSLRHKDADIKVDILPEGARPGTEARPAPTTIPAPADMGAARSKLRYVRLPSLIELKLAAGRARDEADVIELIRANAGKLPAIRGHLETVHADYVLTFDRLAERAREQEDH